MEVIKVELQGELSSVSGKYLYYGEKKHYAHIANKDLVIESMYMDIKNLHLH